MSDFHIWVIKQNKFSSIKFFIEENIPQIEEVFFPTVLRECKIANRVYKRRIPLYSGYLFLKYTDPDKSIFYKLKSNPFVSNYVGQCDSLAVESMKKKEEWNVLSKVVEVGDLVEVIGGPLKRCKGVVNAINGNKVMIKVSLFDREIDYTLSSEDLEIVDR